MAEMHMDVTLTSAVGIEHVIKFPARFAVCGDCQGRGTDGGRSVECDGPYGEGGNGFTASEWAEQDDEFKEDYLAGRYDQPCPTCKGKRVVLEIDTDTIDLCLGAPRRKYFKKLLAFKAAEDREEADYQRLCAMERRMGA